MRRGTRGVFHVARGGSEHHRNRSAREPDIGEIYPSTAFLEMVIDAGNPIALSSDSHDAEHLGFGYDRAIELLGELGIDELAVFEGRERRLVELG